MSIKGYNFTVDIDLVCLERARSASPHNEDYFSIPVVRIGLRSHATIVHDAAFCFDGDRVLLCPRIGKQKNLFIPGYLEQGWILAEISNRRELWPDRYNPEAARARLTAIRILLMREQFQQAADAARNAGMDDAALRIETKEFEHEALSEIMAINLVEKW